MALISHSASIKLFMMPIIVAAISFYPTLLSANLETKGHQDLIDELFDPDILRRGIESLYSEDIDSSECEILVDDEERGRCFLLRALQRLDNDSVELALRDLEESAQLDNSYAKAKLAEISLFSNQPASLDTAIGWYKEAAQAGNPVAEYMFARLGLIFPDKVEESDDHFVQLLRRSADQGINPAIKFLGDINRDGLFDIRKDKIQAFEYYITAAERGYAPAQYEVAVQCIAQGLIEDAVSWLDRAATSGFAPAHYRLGLYYWGQSEVFEDAAIDAVFHLQTAYEAGVIESSLSLGSAYLMGRGVQRDYDRAHYFFSKALGTSKGFAESFLGQIYSRGLGVDKNIKLACSFFQDSALANNPHGQYGHGVCLQAQGEIEQGMNWIRKAADQGLDRALRYIEEEK